MCHLINLHNELKITMSDMIKPDAEPADGQSLDVKCPTKKLLYVYLTLIGKSSLQISDVLRVIHFALNTSLYQTVLAGCLSKRNSSHDKTYRHADRLSELERIGSLSTHKGGCARRRTQEIRASMDSGKTRARPRFSMDTLD